MKNRALGFGVFASLFFAFNAFSAVAPGPYTSQTAEYKFPAAIMPDVRTDMQTELWARVFWPANAPSGQALPILFFLHGNHATCGTGAMPRSDSSCQYTSNGTCPANYVVTPNHEGYNYIAEHLATYGYIVVSINANRGITCTSGEGSDWGANLARGRLILKHMEQWGVWNTTGGAPATLSSDPQAFVGRVALNHAGLMGHSRGGEGARAAITLFQDAGSTWPTKIPGLNIEGIYEIGAVDGQAGRVLDAKGAVWNQLLPACDGDVYNLQGANSFDRMIKDQTEPVTAQKSLTLIYGANHNFFNTEWQRSDASASVCFNHKPIFDATPWVNNEQTKVNLELMSRFFRAHVGANKDKTLSEMFDPMFALPADVTSVTRVDRDFVLSPNPNVSFRVDDFDQPTGKTTRMNEERILGTPTANNNGNQAEITWTKSGPTEAFEVDADKGPMDFSGFESLEFRVSLGDGVMLPAGTFMDFSVSIFDITGKESDHLKLSDFVMIDTNGSDNRQLFKAVHIPLAAFKNVDLTMARTIRFSFDQSATGHLFLANLWLVKPRASIAVPLTDPVLGGTNPAPSNTLRFAREKRTDIIHVVAQDSKTSWSRERPSALAGNSEPLRKLTITSETPFLPQDSLLTLTIGEHTFSASKIEDYTNLKKVSFFVKESEFRQLKSSDLEKASVLYGSKENTSQIWNLAL